MSDNRATRSDLTWTFWLAATPVVLVLYVLGVGPAAWLIYYVFQPSEWLWPKQAVTTLYAPLQLTSEALGLQAELRAYIYLWKPSPMPCCMGAYPSVPKHDDPR
ncbi:hypothetical protein LBMAG53_10510 [Planctomycetota bacterium]|nr:hypothetical protein LBMAG53_10510 [Planctomycetota bacterium]